MEKWDIIIEPNKKISSGEGLKRYLSLISMFVSRDLRVMYTQTILGPLWHIINPLLTSFVFTIVFGKIARLSTDGANPFLFYISGSVLWSYFSSCFTRCAHTFTSNAGLFSKVYFPRLTIPVSSIFSRLATFVIQFIVLLIVIVVLNIQGFSVNINLHILALPLILIVLMQTAYAAGLIATSLTIKYRDLFVVIGLLTQVWMYVTPIVYPASMTWGWVHTLLMLNPISAPVECFRYALLGTGSFIWEYLILSYFTSLIMAVFATWIFNRAEKNFVDKV